VRLSQKKNSQNNDILRQFNVIQVNQFRYKSNACVYSFLLVNTCFNILNRLGVRETGRLTDRRTDL